jgi:hypothetical protein
VDLSDTLDLTRVVAGCRRAGGSRITRSSSTSHRAIRPVAKRVGPVERTAGNPVGHQRAVLLTDYGQVLLTIDSARPCPSRVHEKLLVVMPLVVVDARLANARNPERAGAGLAWRAALIGG